MKLVYTMKMTEMMMTETEGTVPTAAEEARQLGHGLIADLVALAGDSYSAVRKAAQGEVRANRLPRRAVYTEIE